MPIGGSSNASGYTSGPSKGPRPCRRMRVNEPLEARVLGRMAALREAQLLRTLHSPNGFDLSSNDYLRLSTHPRLKERRFVLTPLAEIAPDLMLAGESVATLAGQLDQSGLLRLGKWEDEAAST